MDLKSLLYILKHNRILCIAKKGQFVSKKVQPGISMKEFPQYHTIITINYTLNNKTVSRYFTKGPPAQMPHGPMSTVCLFQREETTHHLSVAVRRRKIYHFKFFIADGFHFKRQGSDFFEIIFFP